MAPFERLRILPAITHGFGRIPSASSDLLPHPSSSDRRAASRMSRQMSENDSAR
jgi:hypothetical protein